MKKTLIFIVVLGMVITLLTATPAKAHWSFFWPGFAVGVGTAVVAVNPFFYSSGYYYPAPPVVYGGGYAYYGGPVYSGYYRPGYRYYGGHYRGYHGGPHGGRYHGR